MASNSGADKQAQPPPDAAGQKTVNVWAKPVDEQDATNPNRHPSISEAVSTIKPEDFANIASTPCARNGFLTGIASGFGLGGLKFILSGSYYLGKSQLRCCTFAANTDIQRLQAMSRNRQTGPPDSSSSAAWPHTSTANTSVGANEEK
jgi:hypothetical protein